VKSNAVRWQNKKKMKTEIYIDGLKLLNKNQIEVLRILYYSPKHSCTAKDLAKILNYKSYHGVNNIIGAIGKKFAEIDNSEIKHYYYRNRKCPAYFELIGPYTEYGWEMKTALCQALEKTNIISEKDLLAYTEDKLSTELFDLDPEYFFSEGKVVQDSVNKYERSSRARKICINHHGAKCTICGFDFSEKYGKIAEGYIQIHHLIAISEIKEEYKIDPIKDLIPVCANCHAVIHLSKPHYSIEEVKHLLKKAT
jgi:predicted HNH restriction endonuclease